MSAKSDVEKRAQLGYEKLVAADFADNTAVLFIRSGDQLYALGELLDPKNDFELYNSLIRLGNLLGAAQRTLWYSVAKRKGLLADFMKEKKIDGLR